MNLDDLRVKPGDPVQPVVETLLRELPNVTRPFSNDSRVRLDQTPQGVNIIVDGDEAAFVPAFAVRLSGGKATVREGYLNQRMPTMNGVPLDGLKDGRVTKIPPLELDEEGPDDEGRSWVCLRVQVADTGLIDPQDKEAVTIVHLTEVASDDDAVGLQPLALIKWSEDGKRPDRVFQITMHNLVHYYVAAQLSQGLPARHFFAAT